MEKYRISAVAKELKLSVTTVYKHVHRLEDRLEGHITKEIGVTYISDAGLQILKNYLSTTQTTAIVTVPANREELSQIDNRLAGIEKVMLILAEEVKNSRREVEAVHQENSALRSQLLQLLPPIDPPKPITPWQPEPSKDPLKGKSWLEKKWIAVFRPWEMRQFDSQGA